MQTSSPPLQLDDSVDASCDAAAALTRGLPRDQALGLRLMALARAAAGMHMGRNAIGAGLEDRAEIGHEAQERDTPPRLLRSQASALLSLFPTRNPSPDTRTPEFHS